MGTSRPSGGDWFVSQGSAETEHDRLKRSSCTASSSSSAPVVKTASLSVRSNVTGDKVYIDGNFKGSTRLDLKLSKGTHTIRIEKDGYEPYEETINLTDNLIIRGNLEKVVQQQVQTTTVQTASAEIVFWQSIENA